MKKKKILSIVLSAILILSVFSVTVYASGPSRSKYYNTVSTVAGVYSGELSINNFYTVASGTGFSSSEIHTYVERKVLGIFWVKVDNGEPNKTWVDTSTSRVYSKDYTLDLTQTGTYRVTAEYTFYGSSGSESITRQQTVTY